MEKVFVTSNGFVIPVDSHFIVGYRVEVGEDSFDVVLEEEIFSTYEEAYDFMMAETTAILNQICETLGLTTIEQHIYPVTSRYQQ